MYFLGSPPFFNLAVLFLLSQIHGCFLRFIACHHELGNSRAKLTKKGNVPAIMQLHGLDRENELGNMKICAFFFSFQNLFCWNIVDLQCVNFYCAAKWFSFVPTHSYSFPLWFITRYQIHFPVYTMGSCVLNLCIIVSISGLYFF